jgi:hypothetical protein
MAVGRIPDVHRALLTNVMPPLLVFLVMVLTTLIAVPAFGADSVVEKQAQALEKKAIEEDSLNVNYAEAIKKLATAIGKCGADKCNASLKGALYRDLGAMLILSGSVDGGRTAFARALGFDSSLDLDPSYKNPMLDRLWNDARKKPLPAGGAPSGAGVDASDSTEMSGGPPSGDFSHVPAAAQLVRTPLPIYVEYLGTEKLLRIVAKYRGAGMTDWKPLELRKVGAGYGGAVPCADVAEGKLQYYVQGYGTSDDAIAASGTRGRPYTVPIKTELLGPAPSLPGQDAPKQCALSTEGGDCPPDFPGCRAPRKATGEDCARNGDCESGSCAGDKCAGKKQDGEDCEKDVECVSGSCVGSRCSASKKQNDAACETDDQCSSGTCNNGACVASEPRASSSSKARKIWIGIAGSFDLLAMPGAENVCVHTSDGTATVNTAGYQCVDPSTGANFPGTNGIVNGNIRRGSAANAGDAVASGVSAGNLRLFLSFDYAFGMNVLLGARAGYVLFTDPASSPGPAFGPIHVEARATFLLGRDALASAFSPMLLVAVGAGEFDAFVPVSLQMTTGETKNENAWLTAGPMFGAVGAGARFLLGPTLAGTVAVKGEGAFGGAAGFLFGIAPEVGMQIGL